MSRGDREMGNAGGNDGETGGESAEGSVWVNSGGWGGTRRYVKERIGRRDEEV